MAESSSSGTEYLHSRVLVKNDPDAGGRPVYVEAGSPASDLKGFTKEQLQELRDAGVLSSDKYEEVGPNDTVPAAATLEEREGGTDEPRSVSMR
jgi:hypothetical protein